MTNPISTNGIFATLTNLYNKKRTEGQSDKFEADIWADAYKDLSGEDFKPVSVADMLDKIAQNTGVTLEGDDLALAKTLLTAATDNDSTFDSLDDFERVDESIYNGLASNPIVREDGEMLKALGLAQVQAEEPVKEVQPAAAPSGTPSTKDATNKQQIDLANATAIATDNTRTIRAVVNPDGTTDYYIETQLTKNEKSYKKLIINEDGTYIAVRCDKYGNVTNDKTNISFEKERALIDTAKDQMGITQEYVPSNNKPAETQAANNQNPTQSGADADDALQNPITIGDSTYEIGYNSDGSVYQIAKTDANGNTTFYKHDNAKDFTNISLEILSGMDRSTLEAEKAFRAMYDQLDIAKYIQKNFSGDTETNYLKQLAGILVGSNGENFKLYAHAPNMTGKFLDGPFGKLYNANASITNVLDALNNKEIDTEQALYCLGKYYNGDISQLIAEFRGMIDNTEKKYIDDLFALLLTAGIGPAKEADTTLPAGNNDGSAEELSGQEDAAVAIQNSITIGDNTYKIIYNSDGSIYQIAKKDKDGNTTQYKHDDKENFTSISLEILSGMDRSTPETEKAFRAMYEQLDIAKYIQKNFSNGTETEKLTKLAEILDGGNFIQYVNEPDYNIDKFLTKEFNYLYNAKASITNVLDALNNEEIDTEQALYCLGKYYNGNISQLIAEFRGMTPGNQEKYIDDFFNLLQMSGYYSTKQKEESDDTPSQEASGSSSADGNPTGTPESVVDKGEVPADTFNQPPSGAETQTLEPITGQSTEIEFTDEEIEEKCDELHVFCCDGMFSQFKDFFEEFEHKPNALIALIDKYIEKYSLSDSDTKYAALFEGITNGLYNNTDDGSKEAIQPMISTLFEAANSTDEEMSEKAINILVDALYAEAKGLNVGYAPYLIISILEIAKDYPQIFEKIKDQYNHRDFGYADLYEELTKIDEYEDKTLKIIKDILDGIRL